MAKRVDKAGGEPFGLDIITIATLFLNMLPQVMQLFAACKKQPPAPPPVPAELAAIGVDPETWRQAHGAKFASEQCAGNGPEGFAPVAIARTAKQIAKDKGIKKKAARPLAIASLQTGRDEAVEEIAVAMLNAKSNAHALGVSK